jgi:hypothetical protein
MTSQCFSHARGVPSNVFHSKKRNVNIKANKTIACQYFMSGSNVRVVIGKNELMAIAEQSPNILDDFF